LTLLPVIIIRSDPLSWIDLDQGAPLQRAPNVFTA
jgi:hypothetical protein